MQRLTKLHTLLVGSNALEDLPDGMSELRVLVLLDLSHNQLRVLSEAVGRLRRLRKLRLTGNPFCSLPAVVVDLQVGAQGAWTSLTGCHLHAGDGVGCRFWHGGLLVPLSGDPYASTSSCSAANALLH